MPIFRRLGLGDSTAEIRKSSSSGAAGASSSQTAPRRNLPPAHQRRRPDRGLRQARRPDGWVAFRGECPLKREMLTRGRATTGRFIVEMVSRAGLQQRERIGGTVSQRGGLRSGGRQGARQAKRKPALACPRLQVCAPLSIISWPMCSDCRAKPRRSSYGHVFRLSR